MTPVCSLCCPVYAAPSAPTHCSCNALPPGFVPVATTPTNACYHGETCNSLQVRLVTWLLRMPIPSFPFPQLVHPLLSDTESTCLPGTISIGIIKVDNSSLPFAGSNAIAVTLQAIGGALLSPTAHAAAISNRM